MYPSAFLNKCNISDFIFVPSYNYYNTTSAVNTVIIPRRTAIRKNNNKSESQYIEYAKASQLSDVVYI